MGEIENITRPLVRYHGGKFLLAPWIIGEFADHKTYVEGFGGGGSVLLLKSRSYAEVYNDLDAEIVNLFRVVRDHGKKLWEALHFTPFARTEFELSYVETEDDFERARRTVVRAYMGFGSAAASGQKTGFRSNSNRSGTIPAHDWANYPEAMECIINRLRGVVIENRDYYEISKQQDSTNTLHFWDPPYVLSTRSNGENTKCYKFEMSDDDHVQMCERGNDLKGMVAICGYENEIYNTILKHWRKVSRKAYADGAAKRVEVLWLNYKSSKYTLFDRYDYKGNDTK